MRYIGLVVAQQNKKSSIFYKSHASGRSIWMHVSSAPSTSSLRPGLRIQRSVGGLGLELVPVEPGTSSGLFRTV